MLIRHVDVRHPIGTSPERREVVRARARWIVRRLLVATAVSTASIAIGAMLVSHPTCTSTSARDLVRRYAFEGFPRWALDHIDRACPASIGDLRDVLGSRDSRDPWGTELELRCGTGIHLAYVRSAGPDRRFDTGDDISSHD